MLLFRRASPDAVERSTGRMKVSVFRLRTAKREAALSFYDSTLVSPEEVLVGAPTAGWGVAELTAGELRALGFAVFSDAAGTDRLGLAHVAARPAVVTDEGQIPVEVSQRLVSAARWVVEPRKP